MSFQWIPLVKTLGVKARVVFSFDAISFILGLGYVMGLRSSMILCAGGVLANLVLVPLVFFVGSTWWARFIRGRLPIGDMSAVQIYRSYVRFMGVGAIATAGIFGIVKSLQNRRRFIHDCVQEFYAAARIKTWSAPTATCR